MRMDAIRYALSGCALMSAAACVHPTPADLFADATSDISVKRMRVRQHGGAAAPAFWSSVSALDVTGARASATTIPERFFTDALSALIQGDFATAEVLFHSLLGDPGPLVRGRARIGLIMALEAQGKWRQLAALGTDIPPDQDTTGTLADRAAVDSWAGVLRDVAPLEVDAPAMPETIPVMGSSVGTPIIRVAVNGRSHYFWLDTGATMSLLTTDVAADCGVVPLTNDTLAIASAGGRIAARPAVADIVRIGNVTIRNLPIAVLDPNALRLDRRVADGRVVPVKLDGVIGSDVLRRLSVVLDMHAGTISLGRPAPGHASRVTSRTSKERPIIWIGFPVVRLLTSDGRPVLFGLDTGADSSIVTDAWMDMTPDPELSLARGSVDALGASHAGDLPVVRRVTVGDGEYILRLRNVPIVQERRQTFVTLDGVLGADVLAHATLHMDMTNGLFSIRAPGAAPFARDTGLVRVHH
jgi:hypothetical protein